MEHVAEKHGVAVRHDGGRCVYALGLVLATLNSLRFQSLSTKRHVAH